METRVPLKFAGRQERAGDSFPPSRLEREEEAGEVPPTPGEREGRRKKGKGEEKRAGPGNHLRLPRPPRPALAGRWWPRAWTHPGGPGTVARSGGSHVAAPLPVKAPPAVGQSPRPTPGPRAGRGGAPRGGGTGAGAAAASPAPAAHLRFCPRGPGQRALLAGDPPGPLWVPLGSPSPPLEGGHGFRAASVDLKEDLVKSPSGQGFCSRLGVRASQLGGGEDSKDFFLEMLQVSFS